MEAKREGLVNGLYISWNLGMWWAWLIFTSAFFANVCVHAYTLNDGEIQCPCVLESFLTAENEVTF